MKIGPVPMSSKLIFNRLGEEIFNDKNEADDKPFS